MKKEVPIILHAYSKVLTEFSRIYLRMLRRHPRQIISIVFVYMMVLAAFLGASNFAMRRRMAVLSNIEPMVPLLREEISQQKLVIASLTSARGLPTVFAVTHFEEDWSDLSKGAEVRRIFEYAHFALSKGDYARATTLFEEAETVQPTTQSQYYLGLLSYVRGDMKSCIARWVSLAEEDSSNRFPDLRLYIAMVLHEMGDEAGCVKWLTTYIEIVKSDTQED